MKFFPSTGAFAAFTAFLLIFSACGDDKSSSPKGLPDEVADKAELKTYECDESIIGVKVFVTDLGKSYECDGEEWFESYDQPKSNAKGKSSSSGKTTSSSSGKNSSSSKKVSSSSNENMKKVCSEMGACDAMDKDNIGTWHFIRNDASGEDVEYTYQASGKDLIVTIKNADGTKNTSTLTVYNMESEAGLEAAFNAAKSTCNEGKGNDRIVKVCTNTLIEHGTVKDERTGSVSETVKIGNQWWMAQNLSYLDSRYEGKISSTTHYGRYYDVAAAVDSIQLYADKKDSIDCGKDSLLMCLIDVSGTITGLCPAGWHLPDSTEWRILFESIGGSFYQSEDGNLYYSGANNLRATQGWLYGDGDKDLTGKDLYGFSVYPTEKTSAGLWSSSILYNYYGEMKMGSMVFGINSNKAELTTSFSEYSVRCIKDSEEGKKGWILPKCNASNQGVVAPKETLRYICDNGVWRRAILTEKDTYGETCAKNDSGRVIKGHLSDTTEYYCTSKGWVDFVEWNWDVPKEARFNPDVNYGSVEDKRDGKVYKTVDIGKLTWMAENLNYADSVNTPSLLNSSWCYEDDEANCDVGGRLYTWLAVIDEKTLADDENNPYQKCDGDTTCLNSIKVQGICPVGWHLPNNNDIESIMKANIKSKSGWNKYWAEQYSLASYNKGYFSGNGTNTSGFTALPTGYRNIYENWVGASIKREIIWHSGSDFAIWSSVQDKRDKDEAWALTATSQKEAYWISRSKKLFALSVRCVKD